MAPAPTVLYPLTLPALLNHVLPSQASTTTFTTLIVCSTRESFLRECLRCAQQQHGAISDSLQHLSAPTLHNLATARHVKLAFCPSVQALLAYLTAYHSHGRDDGAGSMGHPKETLVLINPLGLHASTPSFSAQGLSRTFATATETASRISAKLTLVECLAMQEHIRLPEEENDVDAEMRDEEKTSQGEIEEDPWEQEVPILNVSIRKYGAVGAERPWAGRTVQVKRVAARWFRFVHIKREQAKEIPSI